MREDVKLIVRSVMAIVAAIAVGVGAYLFEIR